MIITRDENMICPNCNKYYNDDFAFCPYCGTEQPEPLICERCGFKSNEYAFCPKCGEKLISQKILNEKRRFEEQKLREAEERRILERQKIKEEQENKIELTNMVNSSSLTSDEKNCLKNKIDSGDIKEVHRLRDILDYEWELKEVIEDCLYSYLYRHADNGLIENHVSDQIEDGYISNMSQLKQALEEAREDYDSGELFKYYDIYPEDLYED